MAKILLIYPRPEKLKSWRFGFSLNLLYLASILKSAGHAITGFLDYSVEEMKIQELAENVHSSDVVIVEIDSFPLKRTTNILHVVSLIQSIRSQSPSIKIIAFGYDLVLFPREIAGADFTCSFEPENSIDQIVDGLITDTLDKNTMFKEPLTDFDLLPFPARNLVSDFAEHGGSLIHKANLAKSTLIQTSRGCLNTCSFCQRKGWQDRYLTHSVEYVIQEFKELKKNKYINVWICDDNFTFNLSRAKQILTQLAQNKISERMKISLSSWTNIDFEFLDLAKATNVSIISYGIESADEEILRFFKKHIDLTNSKKLIEYANEIGLYSVGNFIFGAPMETESSISKTYEYIQSVPFNDVNLKILTYMAGSDLYTTLSEEIKRDNIRYVFACKENGLNQFSLDELKRKLDYFKNYYHRSIHKNQQLRYFDDPPYLLTDIES